MFRRKLVGLFRRLIFTQPELLNENETEAFFKRDTRRPDVLTAAQVVGPNFVRNADGTISPGRAATKFDIEAGTEADRFGYAAPDVMSSSPTIGSAGPKVGRLPELYSGSMSDSPVVGPIFRPAFLTGSGYSDTMIPSFLPDVIDPTTPPAPNMALPDGSAIPSDIQPAGNINKYIEDTFPTDESRDLSPSLYPNELKFF